MSAKTQDKFSRLVDLIELEIWKRQQELKINFEETRGVSHPTTYASGFRSALLYVLGLAKHVAVEDRFNETIAVAYEAASNLYFEDFALAWEGFVLDTCKWRAHVEKKTT